MSKIMKNLSKIAKNNENFCYHFWWKKTVKITFFIQKMAYKFIFLDGKLLKNDIFGDKMVQKWSFLQKIWKHKIATLWFFFIFFIIFEMKNNEKFSKIMKFIRNNEKWQPCSNQYIFDKSVHMRTLFFIFRLNRVTRKKFGIIKSKNFQRLFSHTKL